MGWWWLWGLAVCVANEMGCVCGDRVEMLTGLALFLHRCGVWIILECAPRMALVKLYIV